MAMSAAQYNRDMQSIANAALAAGAQDAAGRTNPSSPVYRQPTDSEFRDSDHGYSGGAGVKSSVSDSGALSASSPLQAFIDTALDISARNNAHSAQQAASLRAWQEEQTRLQQQFNSAEAAKNRDWQQMMSSTAHQREVADLRAAGLNPILSASGGNGAAVTSGATASASAPSGAMGQTDTSANQAITGLLTAFLSAQTQLEAQRVNAQANLAVADKYNAMSKYTAELGSETTRYTAQLAAETNMAMTDLAGQYGIKQADIHAAASKLVAEINRSGTISSAQIHAAASRYAAQLGLSGTQYSAMVNAMSSYAVAQVHYESAKYSADTSYASAENVAGISGTTARDVAELQGKNSLAVAEEYNRGAKDRAHISGRYQLGAAGINAVGQNLGSILSFFTKKRKIGF